MASSTGSLKPIKTHRVNPGRDDEVVAEMGVEVEEPLSPLARVFHTPEVNCFIVCVFGCKTKIDVYVFKRGLTQIFINHPRFSSKLVFDDKKVAEPLKWVRTTVNLDDHVIVPELDSNMESPDQFVEDYASNITKTPMDFSKPLWELHILNVQTSEAASIGILRIHHSLGDGVSIISITLACCRKVSDPNAFPSLPTIDKKTMKKPQTKNSHPRVLRFLLTLMLMFKVFWNTLVDVVEFLAIIMCLKDNKNPLKGGIGIEQAPKRFVHRLLNFHDLKLVKIAMGVTINDVALGITQAGLSRYIYRRSGYEGEGDKNPCDDHLTAAMFVNLRPTNVVQDLENMVNVGSKVGRDWGNKVSYVLCPLSVKSRDDPLEYIYSAKAIIDQKKHSFFVRFTYSVTRFVLNTLGLRAAATIMYKTLSNTTLSFSNVAGPTEEVSFFGHPMVFFAPSIYGFPQALVIHFQSYMDRIAVILSVDEDVIPDPHKLCDEIEKSLVAAKNAIMEKKLPNP